MNTHVRSERRSDPDLAGGTYKGTVLRCVYLLKGNVLTGRIDTENSILAGVQELSQITRRQINHVTTAGEEGGFSKRKRHCLEPETEQMIMPTCGQQKDKKRQEGKETQKEGDTETCLKGSD